MRASIKQVAERAQVSPMTVSRVVNGQKHVNAETYERVMKALRELNYVPTRSTFQNRHVETNTIGYVPHDLLVPHDRIDAVTLEGMYRESRVHGYDVLIMLRDEADWTANRDVVRFLDRRSDGFIFLSPRGGQWADVFEVLLEQDIPVVACYRRNVPEGIAWVDPDNQEIVRLGLEHLMGHGHVRIALLTNPTGGLDESVRYQEKTETQGSFDDLHRQEHFRLRVAQFGRNQLQGSIVIAPQHDWQLHPGTFEFLRREGFTGVLCGDRLGLQLWQQAEAAGCSVPGDLSIVGIDNQEKAAERGLTSIGFGYDEVGKFAVQAWLETRAGNVAAHKVVPVFLVPRRSVGTAKP